jgi:hypothetical protein
VIPYDDEGVKPRLKIDDNHQDDNHQIDKHDRAGEAEIELGSGVDLAGRLIRPAISGTS